MNRKDIELTAPVGSFDSLMAAINTGADSVYFGAGHLNMRAMSVKNFSLTDLKRVAGTCRKHGINPYLTLNTVIYDNEIEEMKRTVDTAYDSGVSAIIASDLAVISYVHLKGMPVHISTQCNVSNIEALKFFSKYADVIVLARELSLEQVAALTSEARRQGIKGASGKPIKIEAFAHGALCMAVSGKCYLSLHDRGKSANRGECVQICRRKYLVSDKETGSQLEIDNEYIMSPKDLCTIGFIDKMIEAGISVFKIEGRGRQADYVSRVTNCYREAIDSYFEGTYTPGKIEIWTKKLYEVYNRGFWGGYYMGEKLGEWSKKYGSHATKKKVYTGKGVNYFGKPKIAEFLIETGTLAIGDNILITGPTTGAMETVIETMKVNEEFVQEATKGDNVTFPLDFKIRAKDILFKIVDAG